MIVENSDIKNVKKAEFTDYEYCISNSLIYGKVPENDIKYHYVLSKYESVKFSLIKSEICRFTDLPLKKYFSLLN